MPRSGPRRCPGTGPAPSGESKLVPQCTYPLTGRACVSRVYTEHTTSEIMPNGMQVLATYGVGMDELIARTGLAPSTYAPYV